VSAPAGISEALLAFHADAESLDLATNRKGHTNEYLDLDKLMGQVRPLLARHGLFVRHYSGWEDGPGWFAGTVIEHVSGESRDSGRFPIVASNQDAQGFGAGLTYAKRYTACEILGLVADNDTDGAPAQPRRGRGLSGKINAAQRTQLMAAARTAKVETAELKKLVKDIAGVESSAEIPADKFDELLAAVKRG